jgi:hypothetical protein
MTKFVRILFLIATVVALVAWGVSMRPPPANLTHGDTEPKAVTMWRSMCQLEAGRSIRDQEDCMSRHALEAAPEK